MFNNDAQVLDLRFGMMHLVNVREDSEDEWLARANGSC